MTTATSTTPKRPTQKLTPAATFKILSQTTTKPITPLTTSSVITSKPVVHTTTVLVTTVAPTKSKLATTIASSSTISVPAITEERNQSTDGSVIPSGGPSEDTTKPTNMKTQSILSSEKSRSPFTGNDVDLLTEGDITYFTGSQY